MMLIRRIALCCALVALAGGLTACGVSSSIDPVAAAASKSQDAGGVKMTLDFSFSGPGIPGGSMTMTASGAFEGTQGEMTMDMGQLLEQAGALPGTDGQMKVIMLQEGGDLVMYLSAPALSASLPGGKPWIRLDLQKAGQGIGVDLNQLMSQATTSSPSQTLEMLKSSKDFAEVGSETIDGAQTTHYKGTVELAEAAAKVSALDAAMKRLEAAGVPTQVPIEAWVGDDGLVRQLKVSYAMTENGQQATMDMMMKMSDYGSTVSVSAPPADQVFDITGLAGMIGKSQLTTPSVGG